MKNFIIFIFLITIYFQDGTTMQFKKADSYSCNGNFCNIYEGYGNPIASIKSSEIKAITIGDK